MHPGPRSTLIGIRVRVGGGTVMVVTNENAGHAGTSLITHTLIAPFMRNTKIALGEEDGAAIGAWVLLGPRRGSHERDGSPQSMCGIPSYLLVLLVAKH